MEEGRIEHARLIEIIKFLASEKGIAMDIFIEEIETAIEKKKDDTSNLMELLMSLPSAEREKILNEFMTPVQKTSKGDKLSTQSNSPSGRFQLKALEKFGINELTNTKPSKLYIDNKEMHIKSWSDATISFIGHLILSGDLRKDNLPLYLSDRSSKAFVNETGEKDKDKDGIFKKVAEGFYVDVKYNAKYHILNMVRALERLNIASKYFIEIEL